MQARGRGMEGSVRYEPSECNILIVRSWLLRWEMRVLLFFSSMYSRSKSVLEAVVEVRGLRCKLSQ